VAANQVLWGALPSVRYPIALRESAARRWRWNGAFSLVHAVAHATRDDRAACAGMVAKAALQAAHGLLALRGEWVLNEKGLLRKAGLEASVAGIIGDPVPTRAVVEARRLLDLPEPPELTRENRQQKGG
jgi:hypothetical protein